MQYTVIVPGVSRVKRHAGISIFHSRVCVFVHDRAVDVFLPAFFFPRRPKSLCSFVQLAIVAYGCYLRVRFHTDRWCSSTCKRPRGKMTGSEQN